MVRDTLRDLYLSTHSWCELCRTDLTVYVRTKQWKFPTFRTSWTSKTFWSDTTSTRLYPHVFVLVLIPRDQYLWQTSPYPSVRDHRRRGRRYQPDKRVLLRRRGARHETVKHPTTYPLSSIGPEKEDVLDVPVHQDDLWTGTRTTQVLGVSPRRWDGWWEGSHTSGRRGTRGEKGKVAGVEDKERHTGDTGQDRGLGESQGRCVGTRGRPAWREGHRPHGTRREEERDPRGRCEVHP